MQIPIELKDMITVVVTFCIIVMLAMTIDLISGLNKAKQRGEVRSSYGLKRTLSKFITYEGSMLIAAGVDIMILYCKIFPLLHLQILHGLPVVTGIVGIFLCVVEFISVREKADKKIKTEMQRVEEIASKMVNKDEFVEVLTKAIINAGKTDKKSEDNGKD